MKIWFSLICIHRLLNHRLRKTGGPLRLGEYIFTYLKHQYKQQRKDLWIKSNFKLVHFSMPTVSLNMESTYSMHNKLLTRLNITDNFRKLVICLYYHFDVSDFRFTFGWWCVSNNQRETFHQICLATNFTNSNW